MTRQKVASGPVLRSWEQADECLRQIALRQIALAKLEGFLQTRLDRVKKAFDEKLAPIVQEKQSLERDLEEFVEARRADFGKAKSRRLVYGRVGFRASTKLHLLAGYTWDAVVALIKALPRTWHGRLLRTKETVNKEAVRSAKMSEQELTGLGLEMTSGDEFGYTLDLERLQQAVEAKAASQ